VQEKPLPFFYPLDSVLRCDFSPSFSPDTTGFFYFRQLFPCPFPLFRTGCFCFFCFPLFFGAGERREEARPKKRGEQTLRAPLPPSFFLPPGKNVLPSCKAPPPPRLETVSSPFYVEEITGHLAPSNAGRAFFFFFWWPARGHPLPLSLVRFLPFIIGALFLHISGAFFCVGATATLFPSSSFFFFF